MATLLENLSTAWLRHQGLASDSVPTSHGTLHVLSGKGGAPQGDDLVLLHGLSGRAGNFRFMVHRLLPHVRRLVVPDLLGHGDSELPEQGLDGHTVNDSLMQALDAVLDAPSVVFGSSLGGYGAIKYASSRPERVKTLVIASPAGARLPEDDFDRMTTVFKLDTHDDALDLIDRGTARSLGLIRHLAARQVRGRLGRGPMREFVDRFHVGEALHADDIRRLTMPTLFLWGDQEQVFPRDCLEWFRSHLPEHVRVECPPDYSHSPPLESPGDLVQRILDFAAEHRPQPSGAHP
jgi:pimeloyl-ACP methyl ester carboxylesterase